MSCRQLIPNPGFESRLSAWNVLGEWVTVVGDDGWYPPAAGKHFVRLDPGPGESVFLETREFDPLGSTEVLSATLGFKARGFSTDPLERNESLALWIEAVDRGSCSGPCTQFVEQIYNDDIEDVWSGEPHDVTELLTNQTLGKFQVIVGASASFVNPTYFSVDEVRLTVCARW